MATIIKYANACEPVNTALGSITQVFAGEFAFVELDHPVHGVVKVVINDQTVGRRQLMDRGVNCKLRPGMRLQIVRMCKAADRQEFMALEVKPVDQ